MKYKYLGKPDFRLPQLVTDKVYELEITTIPWGLTEWMLNKSHPQITEPFGCPYSSWETFYENWEPVKECEESKKLMQTLRDNIAKSKEKECEWCNGTGFYLSGGGWKEACPYCEGKRKKVRCERCGKKYSVPVSYKYKTLICADHIIPMPSTLNELVEIVEKNKDPMTGLYDYDGIAEEVISLIENGSSGDMEDRNDDSARYETQLNKEKK